MDEAGILRDLVEVPSPSGDERAACARTIVTPRVAERGSIDDPTVG